VGTCTRNCANAHKNKKQTKLLKKLNANFSLDFWIAYKLVGGFGLTFTYLIIMMVYLYRGGFLQDIEDLGQPANSSDHTGSTKD